MKKNLFSLLTFAILMVTMSAFVTPEKASAPDFIMKDYVTSVFNSELEARFELQFPELIKDVTDIDVHQTESGMYYYTVYGSNDAGEQVVDYFKTTADEVETETYNYIEMTARTMSWPPRKKCRESFPPPPNGSWCNIYNQGYICGVQVYPYGPCMYY